MACITKSGGEWDNLAGNAKKLKSHLTAISRGRLVFVTEEASLATGAGLSADDLRVSVAVLLFAGSIKDIKPVAKGSIRIRMLDTSPSF